jgi:signal transduction histidine kinase
VADQIAVVNAQAGAAALAEIQSVARVLRGAGEPAGAGPAPGLGRLPDLVAELAAAGFAVEHRERGEPRELPAVADVAAYRIAHEALTTAHRHGVGAARLTVHHRADAVEIEVAGVTGDDFRVHAVLPAGQPTPPPATASERGARPRGRVRPA